MRGYGELEVGGQGIVTVRTHGLNQRDEVVIDFERTIMVPLADAARD